MNKSMAISVGLVTMVGFVSKTFPYKQGNSFSINTIDGKSYRIINFNHENLEELMKRGLQFPIEIQIMSNREAKIDDSRIPENWYSENNY